MKNEENMCEETLYNENQATPVNEAQIDEVMEVEQEPKKGKKTARIVGVGMGLAVLLGSTSSFVASPDLEGKEEPVEPNKEEPVEPEKEEPVEPNKETNDFEDEQQVWTDGNVEVATTVNDEMSFSEAFGAARAEVGAGGAFEWKGNAYSTYTSEEWNNMSSEERDAYCEHFNLNHQEDTDNQTVAAEPAAEQVVAEEPANPETVVAEEAQEEPVVEVDVDVQESTPEAEINLEHQETTENQTAAAEQVAAEEPANLEPVVAEEAQAEAVVAEPVVEEAVDVQESTSEAEINLDHQETTDNQTVAAEPVAEEVVAEQVATEEPANPEPVVAEEAQAEPVVEEAVDVQETASEVEILGVVHTDETDTNLGLTTGNEQEILFIDVDEEDVVVSDSTDGEQVTVDEGAVISDVHTTVDSFESDSFGDTSIGSSDDGMMDYVNDADAVYEV